MNDDDLARALRRLDPAQTTLDAPIPLAAERRARDFARTAPRARRRPVYAAWGSAAAVVVLVLAIVTGVLWMPSSPASALTPQPLAFTSISEDASEVIAQAQQRLTDGCGPSSPERRSLSLGWYFSGSPDEAEATVFRREWIDVQWNENLSGSVVTTAAEATNAAGDTVPAGEPTPGTVVGDLHFVQNQFSPLSPTAPESTVEAMRALVLTSTGAGDQLTAGDAMLGARALLGEWTLTGPQQAALLEVVAQAPGLRVVGSAFDRLGRPVVGLAAVPSGLTTSEATLLLSADTGRIVGFESELLADNPNLKLPAGSITDYTLWDVSDRKADSE
ncbi:hypothetical protein SAMN04487788_2067 [Microbacterium testaceum StLB037]|uniref:Uncharacterized protein n=1 Tax=Microbacterium testaceum (strain StLB037) TaxID=979556 RepID=A0A1H0PYR1_MICTS|nr:hypothetical protein [Microbacterium testaceum]SDP09618.1 hypothetical protein SAMN04487788_2067 [Microbacterium testaceum StLB037]